MQHHCFKSKAHSNESRQFYFAEPSMPKPHYLDAPTVLSQVLTGESARPKRRPRWALHAGYPRSKFGPQALWLRETANKAVRCCPNSSGSNSLGITI